MTEHFRDVRAVAVDGAGHWVHHDRLDRFIETVGAFIRD